MTDPKRPPCEMTLDVLTMPLITEDGEGQRIALDFGDSVETVDVPLVKEEPVPLNNVVPFVRR